MKKSKKAFAIETVVEALQQHGYEKNQITGELVFQGVFDDLGTEIVEGLENKGFLKGNLNDYYRYLKQAKDAIFDIIPEQKLAIDDPLIASARQLQIQLAEKADEKIKAIQEEANLEIESLQIQVKAHNESHAELLKQYESLREELASIKATNQNQANELDSQRQYLVKVETENGMLKSQLQDKERQLEKDRILISDFKETLSTLYQEKEERLIEESQQTIAKAEGQANHYATQLHDASEALQKLEAQSNQDNLEIQKLNGDLNKVRGQLIKLDETHAALKESQYTQLIDNLNASFKAKTDSIEQKIFTVQSDSNKLIEQQSESIHTIIYSPLKEIMDKLSNLESELKELVSEAL